MSYNTEILCNHTLVNGYASKRLIWRHVNKYLIFGISTCEGECLDQFEKSWSFKSTPYFCLKQVTSDKPTERWSAKDRNKRRDAKSASQPNSKYSMTSCPIKAVVELFRQGVEKHSTCRPIYCVCTMLSMFLFGQKHLINCKTPKYHVENRKFWEFSFLSGVSLLINLKKKLMNCALGKKIKDHLSRVNWKTMTGASIFLRVRPQGIVGELWDINLITSFWLFWRKLYFPPCYFFFSA